MTSTKQTQFRLNEKEREFLEFLGAGSMKVGLENALRSAGIENFKSRDESLHIQFDVSLSANDYIMFIAKN